MQKLRVVAGLFIVVALGACADPAKGKPQAEVGEAQPTSEAASGATVFTIAEGSSVDWVGAKVTGTHDGGFKEFEGSIDVIDGDPSKSSVKIAIDTTSLWSDTDRLTGKIRVVFEQPVIETDAQVLIEITSRSEQLRITDTTELTGTANVEKFGYPALINL